MWLVSLHFFFTLPSWREADNCQMMFKCKPPAPRSLSNPSVEKERVTHFVGPTWSENRHGTARATLVLIAPRADEDLLIKKRYRLKSPGKSYFEEFDRFDDATRFCSSLVCPTRGVAHNQRWLKWPFRCWCVRVGDELPAAVNHLVL